MSKTPPWGLWGAATLEELTGQRKARLAAEKARDSVAGQLQEMLARLEDRELELRSAEEALEGLKVSHWP